METNGLSEQIIKTKQETIIEETQKSVFQVTKFLRN